jgi:hypothetical protein
MEFYGVSLMLLAAVVEVYVCCGLTTVILPGLFS